MQSVSLRSQPTVHPGSINGLHFRNMNATPVWSLRGDKKGGPLHHPLSFLTSRSHTHAHTLSSSLMVLDWLTCSFRLNPPYRRFWSAGSGVRLLFRTLRSVREGGPTLPVGDSGKSQSELGRTMEGFEFRKAAKGGGGLVEAGGRWWNRTQ